MSDTKLGIGNTASGTGLLGPISSLISQIQTDARNWATFGINTWQNQKDNEFRQEQWNYQKEMNKIIMEREDNAIQRRAADLAAAGINPLMAAMGDGSGSGGTMGIINPVQPSQISGLAGNNYLGESLNEYTNREFSASEAEKNRLLEQKKIDIERFDAETRRLQEQNTKELNAINEKLKNKELDLEEQKELNAQKNFYDQMANSSKEFAETIAIQKRNAKTAEDRQAMEELNSEAQRTLTRMQGIALNSEISNEEKRLKLQEEKQELEAKLKKSENRRAWTDTIWGNVNKTLETIASGIAKFIPWGNKKK